MQEWNRMTEAEKAPYKNKAETDTARYREAMVAWKAGDMTAGKDDVYFSCIVGYTKIRGKSQNSS